MDKKMSLKSESKVVLFTVDTPANTHDMPINMLKQFGYTTNYCRENWKMGPQSQKSLAKTIVPKNGQCWPSWRLREDLRGGGRQKPSEPVGVCVHILGAVACDPWGQEAAAQKIIATIVLKWLLSDWPVGSVLQECKDIGDL